MRLTLGCAVMALASILVGCGGDNGTGPGTSDFSGDYYGLETFGTFSCTPSVPQGLDTSATTEPRLLRLSQAGSQVTAADLGDTLHFTGTLDPSGNGTLVTQNQYMADDTTLVTVRDSASVEVRGSPHTLSASGQLVGNGQRIPGGQPLATCSRSRSWNLTERSQAVPQLPRIDCSQEATLRPQGSVSSLLVITTNASSSPVDVFAIGPSGGRVFKGHLEAGQHAGLFGIDSAIEPLVVADSTGQCLGIYLPVEGPAFLTLS